MTRNSNAYLPGIYEYGSATLTGTHPNPNEATCGNHFQAVFNENQLIVNVNARIKS